MLEVYVDLDCEGAPNKAGYILFIFYKIKWAGDECELRKVIKENRKKKIWFAIGRKFLRF